MSAERPCGVCGKLIPAKEKKQSVHVSAKPRKDLGSRGFQFWMWFHAGHPPGHSPEEIINAINSREDEEWRKVGIDPKVFS